MGNVYAIRAHTQEPCSNDQTFQIYLRLLHPKAIAEKTARHFFFVMLISGESYCMVFCRKNIFCSKEDFRVVTFS
jgi:hypothetical protein